MEQDLTIVGVECYDFQEDSGRRVQGGYFHVLDFDVALIDEKTWGIVPQKLTASYDAVKGLISKNLDPRKPIKAKCGVSYRSQKLANGQKVPVKRVDSFLNVVP